MKKIIFILFIIFILSGCSYKNIDKNNEEKEKEKLSKYAELSKDIESLEDDLMFYKDIGEYSSLLDENDYKKFNEVVSKLDNKQNNEDFRNLIILIYARELLKDNDLKIIIENLKDKVYKETKKEISKEEENEIFEKNNKCAQLITGITEQLSKKYNNTTSIKEKEELKFVTYSPTLKNCIYVTKYSYNYYSSVDYNDSYNYSSYIIYNASTNVKIDEYKYYHYNYDYLSDEDIKNNKKAYKKYILENTNYNVDLLEDS